MDRREFMKLAGTSAVGLAVSGASQLVLADTKKKESVMTDKINSTFLTEHTLKPLPFDPKKLSGLSEKLIVSHWENNYGGSVKTLNMVNKKLSEALSNKDTPPFLYNGLKREHLMRTGSVILHEAYFGNLGGNGKAGASLQKKIASGFSGFDTWESEFRKIAQGLSGGSGWVLLGYNYDFKTLENYWLADHMHSPAGTIPLLVMDMYEHSYQMDFGAASAKYIDAFFQNINWEVVESRLEKASAFKWS